AHVRFMPGALAELVGRCMGTGRTSGEIRRVGRVVGVVVLAMLAGAAPAKAGPPSVTISASASAGAAPFTVTFEAQGDAVSYHWQLGNGETAEGPTASATYGPGLWTVTATATAARGATAEGRGTVSCGVVSLV